MKLVRYGAIGSEKPGLIDASGQLRDLSGQIGDLAGDAFSPAGLAKLAAPSGKFNPVTQQMGVIGPITFAGPNNYTLNSNGALGDLKTKTMNGKGGVSGTVPQGTFTADNMSADLDGRVVRLDGRARLRIAPRRAK